MKTNNNMYYRHAFPTLVTAVCCLLLGMVSCKKEQPVERLRADMIDFAVSGQKAYIDQEQYSCFIVGEDMRVNSSRGEVVALERNGRQCVIENVTESSNYYAVYPAGLLTNNNEDLGKGLNGKSVTLPRVQHYDKDAFGNQIIQNPMAAALKGASSSNSTLHFRNICALLRIMVQTDDAFDSIRVTIAGKALHGEGTIDTSQTTWKVQMKSPDVEHSVVLAIDNPHESAAGKAFYIVIPEVSLSDDTKVTVRLLNGSTPVKTWSYTTAANVTLAANKIHTFGSFIFNSRVFSVSPTKKVYFSPGNLQWSYTNGGTEQTTHVTNGAGYNKGTWRFAPNQYDIIGADNTNALGEPVEVPVTQWTSTTINAMSYGDYQGWIDLFAWGGSGYKDSRPYYYSTHAYNNYKVYYCENDSLGNYDWGNFNAIYNPKTGNIDPCDTWRMLDTNEWHYLMFNRGSGDDTCRFSLVGIILPSNTTIYGMMIYPDNTTITAIRSIKADVNDNEINSSYRFDMSESQFSQFDELGCAFLPCAGNMVYNRLANAFGYQYTNGHYWTDQAHPDFSYATGLYITSGGYKPYFKPNTYNAGLQFLSVRLVQDVN